MISNPKEKLSVEPAWSAKLRLNRTTVSHQRCSCERECRRAREMSWDFQYALEWMPFSSQQLLLSTVNHCILGMKQIFWMVPYPKRKTRWLPTFLHQIRMSTNSCTFSEDMPVAGQFACPPPIRWLQGIMQLLSTTWAEEHKANPWNYRCAMENCKLIKTQSNSMDISRFFLKIWRSLRFLWHSAKKRLYRVPADTAMGIPSSPNQTCACRSSKPSRRSTHLGSSLLHQRRQRR